MPTNPHQPVDTLTSLYSGYHSWLVVWLRRRLNCPHNAADLAQDTFIRLLTAGAYVPPNEPRAFLATVARRLLVDRSRRQKLEMAYREALELCVEQMAQAPSPEQILFAVQTLERLAKALEGVRPRVREAFILRHLEGWNHQQIADQLKVSTKSVQNYLVEALLACHAITADMA